MNKDEFDKLLDGTENCFTGFDAEGRPNDVDKWVGAWTKHTSPEVAERLCAGCHVVDQCLAYALENNEKDFIWGGTSPEMRKEMRKNGTTRRPAEEADARPAEDPEG